MEATVEKNFIVELTFEFALEIIKYTEELEQQRKYIIANQLLKSGTSIGANVHEAQSAESVKDFVHKIKIAAKEAEETRYWLLLCKNSTGYPDIQLLLTKVDAIGKILTRIIYSTKKKYNLN
jgi:four helix bundle protein